MFDAGWLHASVWPGFAAQAPQPEPFLAMSSVLLGDLPCFGDDGFNYFNPDTEFVSSCFTLVVGAVVSAVLAGPILYRLFDLSRHEKDKLTVFGQLAKIAAIFPPLFYLTSFWIDGSSPLSVDWFIVAVGALSALLHHVQDGRVTVCSPELLLYWLGMIGFYLSVATDSVLRLGFARSWPHLPGAAAAITVFVLELYNPSRGRKDIMAFDDITIFQKMTMAYATPVINKGAKEALTREDLPKPPTGMNAVNCYTKLQTALDSYSVDARWRVIRSVMAIIRSRLLLLIIVDTINEVITYLVPSVLGLFLDSLMKNIEGEAPFFVTIYYAILMGIMPTVTTSLDNIVGLMSNYTYVISRTSLVALIYRKSLQLAPKGREQFDSAKIMNLINVDTAQVDGVASMIPSLISAPLAIVVSTYQLWRFIGPSMFAAAVFYALCLPATGWLSWVIGTIIPESMKAKDARNKLTSNVFRNIKSLKLYAWEKPFYDRIVDVRVNQELVLQRKTTLLFLGMSMIWNMLSDLIAAAVFIVYLWLRQGALTPAVIFPTLMLLQYATSPFMMLPMAITSVARAVTSQGRINELLLSPSQDYTNYYRTTEPAVGYDEKAVAVQDATISWNGEVTDEKIALSGVSFSATRGDLVCVTGRVGAGKTALLRALAGELAITSGSVSLKGSVAYCTQEAWLQNRTLKDNILFGQKLDEDWYRRVLDACELIEDIKQLPKQDDTNVGERGISLSGGQKARVALARAVYSKSNIYLLDDVLSAVDEHVSAKLTAKLFSKDGILANRTIILATNNVKVLSHASLIVGLQDKKVAECDPFRVVVSKRENSAVYNLIKEFGHASDLEQEAEHIEDRRTGIISRESSSPNLYLASEASTVIEPAANYRDAGDDDEEEEKQVVSLWIFKRYFSAVAPWYSWLALLVMSISVVVLNSLNVFLGIISNHSFTTLLDARTFLIAYLGLIIFSAVLLVISQIVSHIMLGQNISKVLHNRMLWNTMQARMSFFDSTPLGRLINRFTGDIAAVDSTLPSILYYTIRSIMNAVMNIIIVISGSPFVTIVVIPLAWVGNLYRQHYVPASRKVSRMSSAANSPILSHIEESLKGQAIVRAFDRTTQFIDLFDVRVDSWIEATFLQQNMQRWLYFRVRSLAAILMLATSISIAILVNRGALSVGYGAIVIHFASRTGVMVLQILNFLAQMEIAGVSLERILEYIDLTGEAASHIPETEPASDWPERGEVAFKELSARYKPDGPDVLKNLTFSLNQSEKIGIVGRTGSGKSSLTMAIFRILEAHAGHVEIDNVDTSKLGLFDLRSRLSIIPQDAQIFDGTLRENLDPLKTVDDTRLWEVLELCHLKDHFQKLGTGLDALLTDGGENLSRGQSQLVCLGRALIHKAHVLVLDEATASVDVETDKIVQETIRRHFSDRTIITIAHRLNTIMDSDRIIVLEAGEIKEFDTPERLLEAKGLFYSLYTAEKREREQQGADASNDENGTK